ncbi:hypothetical protein ACH4VX_20850 [Streptomyces sp. NPDC020731]|uniref:hypothetical protein n=1 Tax=Streptomyces sp. NPDC020731 TaxID=3365085 RepID=UPI0037892C56
MSTEARRASHPPRPTVPPRPAHPPEPAGPDTDEREGPENPARPTAPEAGVPRGRTSGGSGPFAPREPARTDAEGPRGETSRGAGAFEPREPARTDADGAGVPRGRTSGASGIREPARPSAGDAGSGGPSAPRPRFPSFGEGVPAGTDPVAPPPPRASARFPDTQPTAGRGARPPGGSPSVPPQPTHRPTPRGTGTPPETPSETTTRLRAVPPARPGTGEARRSGTASDARPGTGGTGRAGADPAYAPTDAPRPTWRPGPGDPAPDARPAYAPADAPRPTWRPPAGEAAADVRPGAGAGSTGGPDPALSWSAPMAPGGTPGAGRPVVSFGEPEGYDEGARARPLGRRGRSQAVVAAACLVLGTGLIGGAVTGSWLAGDSDGPGARHGFAAAQDMWHDIPVDQLFPPTVQGKGAGPGGADRSWTRIAVAPDSGCKDAFDALLRKVLAPVGCERLLRATYTDATQSHVTTVGLLFTKADAAAMTSLARRFDAERLDRRTDLMPLPYAAKGTAAAGFGAEQRATWAISVLTDAPVVVWTVSGWTDGRSVDTPQPAEDAMESGATTAPAQAGLGHEAQGLADRVERGLRKKAGTVTEQPS